MKFTRKFEFDAAHTLTKDFGDKETKLHGHRYRVGISTEGPVKKGMAVNLNELKNIVQTGIIGLLDHSNLNDYIEVPSAENIAIWIWNKLKSELPELVEIKIYETPNHWVTYNGCN